MEPARDHRVLEAEIAAAARQASRFKETQVRIRATITFLHRKRRRRELYCIEKSLADDLVARKLAVRAP